MPQRPGKRPKAAADKRSVMLTLRLKPEEHERIRKRADAEGLSPGVWIRHVALKAVGVQP